MTAKTLEQLWQENGSKPFRARREGWDKDEWFEIRDRAPSGGFIGWDEGGQVFVHRSANDGVWHLVRTPGVKRWLWAWKNFDDQWVTQHEFCRNEDEFRIIRTCPDMKLIRLDFTETEFPE